MEEIVFGENKNNAPNRVVVMDDLMNDAFNPKDKEVNSTMNLLMTKLSHHNNILVLIVCHEIYPKGTKFCSLARTINLNALTLSSKLLKKQEITFVTI